MDEAMSAVGDKQLNTLKTLQQLQQDMAALQKKQVEEVKQLTASLGEYFGKLRDGLTGVDAQLKSLREQGVTLPEPKRRRRWFGRDKD
jgi:DNA-binding protein H-NS